jgi:hypothetical protein
MYAFFAFVAGLVFGIGLLVSGMVNPAKVLGFLDLAGRWDPSLALVMVGAIAIGAIGFAIAGGRKTTLLRKPLMLPTAGPIDRRLVFGGVLFGIGWGSPDSARPRGRRARRRSSEGDRFVAADGGWNAVFEWIEDSEERKTLVRLEPAAGGTSE